MATPLNLPSGQHELIHPVSRWHSQASGSDPTKVVLTATTPKSDTTLALQMDTAIAKDLHETLGELGRSMGWLPKEK